MAAAAIRSQWVVVSLAALLLTLALAFLLLRLLTPFDNGRLQPGSGALSTQGVIVTPLVNGPHGFEAGDSGYGRGGPEPAGAHERGPACATGLA